MKATVAALSVLCVALGLWYASFYGKPNKKKALAVKTAASLTFTVVGIICLAMAPSPYGRVILAALIVGAVADVILGTRFVFPNHKQKFFLAGTAVFAAGHIIYVVALNMLGNVDVLFYVIGIALGIIICGLPMLLKKAHYGRLRVAMFGYAVILGIMVMCALSCAFNGHVQVFVAASMFALSDMLLLLITFVKGNAALNTINLFTYYAAQALFGMSVLTI